MPTTEKAYIEYKGTLLIVEGNTTGDIFKPSTIWIEIGGGDFIKLPTWVSKVIWGERGKELLDLCMGSIDRNEKCWFCQEGVA